MTQALRDALRIFEHFAGLDVTLSSKTRMQILCRGYQASALGWRLIATGEGDEAVILASLTTATMQLHDNERRRRGPKLTLVQSPIDEKIIRRFFERDAFDLTLRHFVEAAFDAGELDKEKRFTIDVHVNRMQRHLDKG